MYYRQCRGVLVDAAMNLQLRRSQGCDPIILAYPRLHQVPLLNVTQGTASMGNNETFPKFDAEVTSLGRNQTLSEKSLPYYLELRQHRINPKSNTRRLRLHLKGEKGLNLCLNPPSSFAFLSLLLVFHSSRYAGHYGVDSSLLLWQKSDSTVMARQITISYSAS